MFKSGSRKEFSFEETCQEFPQMKKEYRNLDQESS